MIPSKNAMTVLKTRYLSKDESREQRFKSVTNHVASAEKTLEEQQMWSNEFYEMMESGRGIPNSPTLVNAGKPGKGSLSACFVISPEDTLESIMQVARDAALVEKWGGGIGFSFSNLRPKNSPIATTHGMACGPIAVMKLYSQVGKTLTQGAFRLGAHMGQLHISHPDIREFIHCKDSDDDLQNFNISVQIPDTFMSAVEKDGSWNLIDPSSRDIVETLSAKELWTEICESAWKTGDPGVVFMDRVLETQPNPSMGNIQTSNPCGEEFLENYGNCCLGSIDVNKHVKDGNLDYKRLENTVQTFVRFLDDVIEVNQFPLEKLRETNLRTRRIGLGVMGWADYLVSRKIKYDSQKGIDEAKLVGSFIKETAISASVKLAEERGAFPEWENSSWKSQGYRPMRHSSVTTIAPTGTISRIADCSSGIEPHFSLAWYSNVLWKDHAGTSTRMVDAPIGVREAVEKAVGKDKVELVLSEIADSPDTAEKILVKHGIDSTYFRTAHDINYDWHVKMQAEWQKHTTNSVSKTINMKNSATVNDVLEMYKLAWEEGCKAVTVYRDGSKSLQVLETGKKEIKEIQEVRVPEDRPRDLRGTTSYIQTGHGKMWVNITEKNGKPFEVFVQIGKGGHHEQANGEAIGRLVSLAMRSGVAVEDVVSTLSGITCCPQWDEGELVKSVPDGVAKVLSRIVLGKTENHKVTDNPAIESKSTGPACPDCDSILVPLEGCYMCPACGYSKCG